MNALTSAIPPQAFAARLKKVQEWLSSSPVDVLVLSNLQNIYWLTGTAQYANLILPRPEHGDPILFVRRNFERAQGECNACDVRPLNKTGDWVDNVQDTLGSIEGKQIGMELSLIPATYYLRYQENLPGASIVEVGEQMRRLRMVKDQYEIERHQVAGTIATKTQLAARDACRPGNTECDVAAVMAKVSKENGAEHFCMYYARAFFNNWFIVASGNPADGANLWTPSSFPIMSGAGTDAAIPYGASERVLEAGDMVVTDYAMIYKGYHSDHCRSHLVDGMPDLYKERYEALYHAYQCGLDLLTAGTPAEDVFVAMKDELAKEELDKYFCGDGKYYQSVGHGIGLELDEPPFFLAGDKTPLEENMVVSLEPKLIIPGWGAINFEDNWVVKVGTPLCLTNTPYLEF
jgi:Xaa-Pro aminopeptidase